MFTGRQCGDALVGEYAAQLGRMAINNTNGELEWVSGP